MKEEAGTEEPIAEVTDKAGVVELELWAAELRLFSRKLEVTARESEPEDEVAELTLSTTGLEIELGYADRLLE